MEKLDFSSLLQVHKQEAAEGWTAITAFAVVALGILGYFGAAEKVNVVARIGIAIGFMAFAAIDLGALLGSLRLHNAIHIEIQERVSKNDDLVTTEELRRQFKEMSLPSPPLVVFLHLLIDILILAAILLMGKDNILNS